MMFIIILSYNQFVLLNFSPFIHYFLSAYALATQINLHLTPVKLKLNWKSKIICHPFYVSGCIDDDMQFECYLICFDTCVCHMTNTVNFFLGCLSVLVPYHLPFFGRRINGERKRKGRWRGIERGREKLVWSNHSYACERGETDVTELNLPLFSLTTCVSLHLCLSLIQYNLPPCLYCQYSYHLS